MNLTTATVDELYNAIENLITQRSVYGRGRTPEAAHFRSVITPEIRSVRRELNRRKLPSRLWQYRALCEAEDVADLHDTQQSVLEAML